MNIRNPGFTMVELLIAMALIATLAAIAIPQYHFYRSRSSNAVTQSDLRDMRRAMEAYFSDNACYPTF